MGVAVSKKVEEREVISYSCTLCRTESSYESLAQQCSDKHKGCVTDGKPGELITVDDGSYGGEQGQVGVSWYPEIKDLRIVNNRTVERRYLAEREDGTRKLFPYQQVRTIVR